MSVDLKSVFGEAGTTPAVVAAVQQMQTIAAMARNRKARVFGPSTREEVLVFLDGCIDNERIPMGAPVLDVNGWVLWYWAKE